MNPTHRGFFDTPEGRRLRAVIEAEPHRSYGYPLMTRLGLPAIQACAFEIEGIVSGLPGARRNFAIQACGALVGDLVIGEHGAARAQKPDGTPRRGRVRGTRYIRTGAVWRLPERPVPGDTARAGAAQ